METARAVKEDKATGKMMLYVRVPVSSSLLHCTHEGMSHIPAMSCSLAVFSACFLNLVPDTMTTGVTGNLKQLAKSPTMPKISQAALASSPSTESGKTFPTNPPINPPEIKTGSRVSPGKRAETPSMKAPSLPRAKINKSTAWDQTRPDQTPKFDSASGLYCSSGLYVGVLHQDFAQILDADSPNTTKASAATMTRHGGFRLCALKQSAGL